MFPPYPIMGVRIKPMMSDTVDPSMAGQRSAEVGRYLGKDLRLPDILFYVKYVSLIAQIRIKGTKTGVFSP